VKLLVVEDDQIIASRINATCCAEGLLCHIAEDGIVALEMIKLYDYDAVILDLKLPDIDGIEILTRLRSIRNGVPVVVLSGLNTTEDKVKCLTMGADDYLTKPFSKTELIARIHAVIRRSSGHFSSIINVGPIEINIKQRSARIYAMDLALTNKEYAVLELLAIKRGSILPKEAFLNYIYGGMDEPEQKIVDVFVCRLRKKIAAITGGLNFIETIWGRGYILRELKEEEIPQSNTLKVG
jgi:two-component system cell cycle response regulator CtrA